VRLLLDTHIWLWSVLDPDRLSDRVASAIDDPASELWLSPITVWETLLLAEKGRLRLDLGGAEWIARQLRKVPLRDAALTREVASASRQVEVGHQDPADRFLAATAVVYGLTLVTADAQLLSCPSLAVLANL